jgi:hypothetical protein
VFPEAQPREWAALADNSSEWLGKNSCLRVTGSAQEMEFYVG